MYTFLSLVYKQQTLRAKSIEVTTPQRNTKLFSRQQC